MNARACPCGAVIHSGQRRWCSRECQTLEIIHGDDKTITSGPTARGLRLLLALGSLSGLSLAEAEGIAGSREALWGMLRRIRGSGVHVWCDERSRRIYANVEDAMEGVNG